MRNKIHIGKVIGLFLIVIVFLILGILNYLSYLWDSQQYLGMTLEETGKGLVVTAIQSGSLAEKEGVYLKDLLLSVNGDKVSNLLDYRRKEKSFRYIEQINLSFQRNEKTFTAVLSPEIRISWESIFPAFLIVCVYLSIGFLSLWKKSEDLRVRLLFLLTVFASITIIAPDYFVGQKGIISQILSFFVYASIGILIGVEPHLAMVIPKKKAVLERHPWIIRLLYASGIILAALYLINYFDYIYQFGYPSLGSTLTVFLFMTSYHLLVPLLVFGILLHTFFKTPFGVMKSQTKIVLFGIFPWVVGMIWASLSLIIKGMLSPFLVFFNLLTIIPIPIAFSIAIFKYRLFNVELVIRKSLIYGLLTGFLFSVYLGIIGLGSGFLSIFFIKVSSIWIIAFATLLLGLLFNPVRKKIRLHVDKFFFPEKFNLRHELPELSKEIASVIGLNKLVNKILDKLSTLLNMNSSAFLLSDERLETYLVSVTKGKVESLELEKSIIFSAKEEVIQYIANQKKPLTIRQLPQWTKKSPGFIKLQRFTTEVIIPFHFKNDLIAILLLGGKQSEEIYDREDKNLLAIFSNQVAAMIENSRLFKFATFDDLTGLYRRQIFEKELEKEMERVRRFHRPLVIGLADIDHFKRINDQYGHSAGDIVLKNISICLSSKMRTFDCVARYGGEEFVFFLPETDIESGKKISERLRTTMQKLNISLKENSPPVQVTISVGLTCWDGKDKDADPDSLIKLADKALYQAKKRGRNRTDIIL